MPFYEYLCASCNHIEDVMCSMSDMKKWVKCPECGKRAKRHMSDGSIADFTVEGGTPTFYRNQTDIERDNTYKAHKWHDEEVRNTAEAIKGKTGVSPYSQMKIDHEVLRKAGIARKATPEEAEKKRKRAIELNKDAVSKLKGIEKEHTLRGSGNSGQTP